jgi:hypothetical protein
MRAMPAHVAQIRQDCCRRKGCTHALDYTDPCVACPSGHFGQWMRCDTLDRPLSASQEPPRAVVTAVPGQGPGTELKRILAFWGIVATPSCACHARADEMDARGPDWCEANQPTILGWLREESQRRRLPFAEVIARRWVRQAIKRARKAALSPPKRKA